MNKLGATGNFPDGKLNEHDDGEFRLLVKEADGNVHIYFGKPVAWLALPKEQAFKFALTIMKHAGAQFETVAMPTKK